MQGAWNEALKRFLAAVNADRRRADHAPGASLPTCGSSIANQTLVETHRTPEFLEAQRRLTRSSTECRLAEREIAEAYCEMHHIPTRTEVDELRAHRERAAARAARAAAESRAACESARRRASAPLEIDARARHAPACNSIRRRPSTNSPISRQARARQRAPALGQGPGRRDRRPRPSRRCSAGQDDALPLRRRGAEDRARSRSWWSTASSAATRWPTCRRTARSMRNLLAQGVDLYAVDWGNPDARRPLAHDRRLHRRLPRRLRRPHLRGARLDQVTLLGICEGGVFTTCYAALHPERVKNLMLTITPIDFHADRRRTRRPRLHQPVDAQPDARGRRPPDRGQRQPARRAHELRVLDDDAARTRSPSTTSACST